MTDDPDETTETKTEHFHAFYGRMVSGYGPSMDPHVCGNTDEPCVTITYERKVTPWREVNRVTQGTPLELEENE